MLDQMIQHAFDQMADADQPPARVSVAQAIRQARVRRRLQRLTAAGTPVLAAGAALAVALSGALVSGVAGTRPTSAGPDSLVAPQRFNPLVPYATVRWYPYRIPPNGGVIGYAFPTALWLSSSEGNVVVYAANQCVQTRSRLVCGAAANGTSGELALGRRAPAVAGHAAYWVQQAGGDLTILPRPARHSSRREPEPSPLKTTMVAFQYARHGWAMVASTGTPAVVIRIAASLRYGQTAPVPFPIRLTGLPQAWREVQVFRYNADPLVSWLLYLGRHPIPDGFIMVRGALYLWIGLGRGQTCHDCGLQGMKINGYKVYLSPSPASLISPAGYGMVIPSADGLNLSINEPGPDERPSLVLFAHHLRSLGPDPKKWTAHLFG
jgi:hypothetical protein